MTWIQKRGSKYGAKKTVTGGRQYDSKKEAGVAQQLELRRLAGEIQEVRPQVTLQLFSYGQKLWRYRTDFVVKVKVGEYQIVEAKGFETMDFKRTWRALECCIDDPIFRSYNGFTMDDDLQMVLIK